MKTAERHNATQHRETVKSEKEVRKQNGYTGHSSASKFAFSYWSSRVFRPKYSHGGEVAEWYCQVQHAGRREKIGLATNDRQEAARRAARLFQRVKLSGWDAALAEFSPGRAAAKGVPTVGELVEAAGKAADIAPSSFRNYAVCLRRIAAEAFGIRGDESRFDYHGGGTQEWRLKVDRIRLDRLTPARVQAALNSRVAAARGNPLAEQRARTTAASILRQARSLFSPRLKLPFASLPNPFEGVRLKESAPRRYVSTIDAGNLLQAAKAELAESDPEAFKALLLALGAGLRKAEIDTLQWQQIDAGANVIRVETTDVFDPKSEASAGEVFVDPGLIAELEVFRAKATSLFVLESPFAPRPNSARAFYRAAATFDRLTGWLRSQGILAHKPLHALRKEFGSIIAAGSDVHTASRQLRHASIGITSSYYLDQRRRVAPPVGAMLHPDSKPAAARQSR